MTPIGIVNVSKVPSSLKWLIKGASNAPLGDKCSRCHDVNTLKFIFFFMAAV